MILSWFFSSQNLSPFSINYNIKKPSSFISQNHAIIQVCSLFLDLQVLYHARAYTQALIEKHVTQLLLCRIFEFTCTLEFLVLYIPEYSEIDC